MNKVMADKKAIMIFTLPCLIFFGLIAFYPVFQTVIMSFFDWDGLTTKTFTGLANYIKLFQDRIFWTSFRNSFLVAGVLIVFMYEKIGRQDGGTNQVLATIKSKDDVPFLSAPLYFVSTLLTHLTGGSAGREGASIQFGGSIGYWLGKLAHLDEFDHHVMIMCGMSAAFAAVFGTPMAAAVFAMEVVSVGVMLYAALLQQSLQQEWGLIRRHFQYILSRDLLWGQDLRWH